MLLGGDVTPPSLRPSWNAEGKEGSQGVPGGQEGWREAQRSCRCKSRLHRGAQEAPAGRSRLEVRWKAPVSKQGPAAPTTVPKRAVQVLVKQVWTLCHT